MPSTEVAVENVSKQAKKMRYVSRSNVIIKHQGHALKIFLVCCICRGNDDKGPIDVGPFSRVPDKHVPGIMAQVDLSFCNVEGEVLVLDATNHEQHTLSLPSDMRSGRVASIAVAAKLTDYTGMTVIWAQHNQGRWDVAAALVQMKTKRAHVLMHVLLDVQDKGFFTLVKRSANKTVVGFRDMLCCGWTRCKNVFRMPGEEFSKQDDPVASAAIKAAMMAFATVVSWLSFAMCVDMVMISHMYVCRFLKYFLEKF